jgi:hypothetical protein
MELASWLRKYDIKAWTVFRRLSEWCDYVNTVMNLGLHKSTKFLDQLTNY